MRARSERGSIVSLLCDRGDRYDRTLYDREWLRARGFDPNPSRTHLAAWLATGVPPPASTAALAKPMPA
jgi:cysteine synthase A